jgi:ribonuclease P protein component
LPGLGHLTRRAEFLRAAAKGRKAPMPGLVLQALPRNDDGPARLGFTVTKKIGNAVMRNRTRRRLKEAARLVLAEQPPRRVDLVLIGRAGTAKRSFSALQDDLRRALTKALRAETPRAEPQHSAPVFHPKAGAAR